MLRAEFRLPTITAEESAPERKAPIRVKFEIPYFTVSGIQVRLLDLDYFIFHHDMLIRYCIYLPHMHSRERERERNG